MKCRKTLTLTIPKPCEESWSEMTPQETGRYCAQCKKCVVDFTQWTDAALYKFFATNTDAVCGRFTAYQLEKTILSPSRAINWYRIACGLGLSLLLASAPSQAHFMVKPSFEQLYQRGENDAEDIHDEDSLSSFKGSVLDEKAATVIGAVVRLSGDNRNFTAITDQTGHFAINNIPPGFYHVRIIYNSYKTETDMLVFQKDSVHEKMYRLELDASESHIYYTGSVVPKTDMPALRQIPKFEDEK